MSKALRKSTKRQETETDKQTDTETDRQTDTEYAMEASPYGDYAEVLRGSEALVQSVMSLWDSSHDSFHAFRVRDLALSLAAEEGLSTDQKKIVGHFSVSAPADFGSRFSKE